MTTEQKVKAYDEALERAKKLQKTCDSQAVIGWCEYIFPELKENDDERMWKLIKKYAHANISDMALEADHITREELVTWLEKQGDKDKLIKELGKYKAKYTQEVLEKHLNNMSNKDNERLRKTTISFLKEFADKGYENSVECIDWLEKQGKQKSQRMISAEAKEAMYDKPANTVEQKCEESKTKIFDAPTPFEDKLYAFVAACEFLAIPSKIEFILEHSQEILDAAREQIGKEQSSAWSEEDELVVEDIEEAVINYWHGQSQEDLLDWLKSLKTKVQPKQEWSEKDEEELEIAIDTLKESGRYDSAKWVQSLKRRIGGKL